MDLLPFELIGIINSFLDNISDVSKLRRTCKLYMKLLLTPRQNDNSLLILLKLYPNKHWDWFDVTCNPNITIEHVIDNPSLPWDITALRWNVNITPDVVRKYKDDFVWNYDDLCLNDNFTIEDIREFTNKLDIYNVSGNIHLSLETIKKSPEIFNYYYLSNNPNLTWEFISQNLDKRWDWDELGRHSCVTLDIIKKHPDLDWNMNSVSSNPNITLNQVLENPDLEWNWENLSYNLKVTPQMLRENMHLNWSWVDLTKNQHISSEDIKSNRDLPWIIRANHPIIDMNTIRKGMFDYWLLSTNPNINWKFVQDNINEDWNWSGLSRNRFGK